MSWLSKGIKGLGHVLAKPVGFAERAGGTVGGFLVGGPAGAVAGYRAGDKIGNIAEDALAGRNVKKHLASNLIGAAEGGAGVYGSSKIPGAPDSAAASAVPSGTTDWSDPNFNEDQLYGSDPAQGGSGSPGGWLHQAVDAGKTLIPGQNSQPGQPQSSTNPWLLGLAGLQGANSAYLGQKSNALSDKALKGVEANYADRAPLRAAGLRGLLNPTAPDTTQLSTIAQRNPYAAPPVA